MTGSIMKTLSMWACLLVFTMGLSLKVHVQHLKQHGKKDHGGFHGWFDSLWENFCWVHPKLKEKL